MTDSDLFGPLCLLAGFLTALLLLVWERRNSVHTSPPAFLFYLTLALGSFPTFKVQVEDIMAMDGNR